MPLVVPTPIDALPPAPSSNDPTDFDVEADAFVAAERLMVPQQNQANADTYANALEAQAQAAAAGAGAVAAQNSAANAAAIANYKGAWASLSGALAIPATVSHNGVTWILVASTGNVAAITPGVSNQWLPAQSLTHVVHVTGTSHTGVAYEHVSFENAAQSTASFPPSPAEGTLYDFTNVNGRFDNVFTANGSLVEGDADDITLNIRSGRFKFLGASAGGWRLQQ